MLELGKSTLVKFIIAALTEKFNVREKDIVYCAFTGKACQVLQKKGNKNVSTLHRLLYKTKPLPNGKFITIPRDSLEYKIIVVDESSMMPMEMAKQLFSYSGIYVICLGDNMQLPPINPEDDNHLLDSPHIFLDEIMRQAAESEIIQLTMKIREGKELEEFKGKEVQVLSRDKLSDSMLLWADQIICATNNTRIAINNKIRELLGRSGNPKEGDKIICLSNYWDCLSENEEPLVNGTIGYLQKPISTFYKVPSFCGVPNNRIDIVKGGFITDSNETYNSINMDKGLILNGVSSISKKSAYIINHNKKLPFSAPFEFTYGYSITCHKSQRVRMAKDTCYRRKFSFFKRRTL